MMPAAAQMGPAGRADGRPRTLERLIALLEQAVPAEKICEAITLCDKPAVAAAPSNDDCATCEFVLASAKTALSDNSTITSIVAKANDLCEEYAGDYAQECEEYVTAWGPQLLAKLAAKFPHLAKPRTVDG